MVLVGKTMTQFWIGHSVVFALYFISGYFWGIRGAIVCFVAPPVIEFLVGWIHSSWTGAPNLIPLSDLLPTIGFMVLFFIPYFVVGFIASGLGIAFGSIVRRRMGK